MDRSYWYKQQAGKPLFPDLLWSRPESKQRAGKLLIIGGNLHSIAAPAEAYQAAISAGVGTANVLLPDAVQKMVGFLDNTSFVPSTPSGSFARSALAETLSLASLADAVLIAGDLGRNAETSIFLESFLSKFEGSVTITKDAADEILKMAALAVSRAQTTLVVSLAQLQKIFKVLRSSVAVTFSMSTLQLVDALHDVTKQYPVEIVVKHFDQMHVAVNGQVSSTKIDEKIAIWRVKTASRVCVWRLQSPSNPFRALSTALCSPSNT